MMDIERVKSWVRPHLLKLQPYSSARDEFDQSSVDASQFVYLDANENPFDTGFNRYPDPHQRSLKSRIAAFRQVDVNQIFLGNGSDEAIDLVTRLFCRAGDNILLPTPTYGMYKVSAEINEIGVRTTLLTSEFQLPSDFLGHIDSRTRVIFLCSPNNPSGNLLQRESIRRVLEGFDGVVVVDEAYIDFTSEASWLSELNRYPNLVVLQTFSKAWGLAGLRLGMAFAHPAIIELLDKIKPPYNISAPSQQLALKAIDQPDRMRAAVATLISERSRLADALKVLPSVERVFPSDANFVLVRIRNAGNVYHRLVEQKIVVRDRSSVKLCEDCLRITVGTPEENNQLLSTLQRIS